MGILATPSRTLIFAGAAAVGAVGVALLGSAVRDADVVLGTIGVALFLVGAGLGSWGRRRYGAPEGEVERALAKDYRAGSPGPSAAPPVSMVGLALGAAVLGAMSCLVAFFVGSALDAGVVAHVVGLPLGAVAVALVDRRPAGWVALVLVWSGLVAVGLPPEVSGSLLGAAAAGVVGLSVGALVTRLRSRPEEP